MLEVSNLYASYGGIKALSGVSINVREGEIVAVLGSNGAGKSTLLKCISSMKKPESGTVLFEGGPVPPKPYDVVALGLSHAPEGRQIFPNLTVYENLMVGAIIRKDKNAVQADLENTYRLFPRLKEREAQYGGLLSGGEQQMLAISRGLMAHPKLLMLDEPSLGLAPIVVDQIFDIIKEINRLGTSILLVEQNAVKALSICSRTYVLSVGKVAYEGTSTEVLADKVLLNAYIGS